MPFGLCNAPATFERLMETVLAGLNWQICLIYLDDIIVHGRTFDEMLENLQSVLQRLQDSGLKLKPRKCQLFCREVEYLGHIISPSGIQTDPKKVEAVKNWPVPHSTTELRSFIGLCSYYRKFIRNFADIAKPLHKLTEKSQTFLWTNECNEAFTTLKQALVTAPIIAHPDFSKEFILDTDASDVAIGAVLSQNVDGKEHVIACASKTMTKSEKRYCVTRKELLAVVHFVKYFRHYLYGRHFTVRTDHGSLRWLMQFKNPEGQVARWIEVLSSYDLTIIHRPGRLHNNADGMSRIRCKQCGLKDDEREAETETQCNKEVNVVKPAGEAEVIDNLRTAQENDAEVAKVIAWIKMQKRPHSKDIASESYFVKSLVAQWERLEVKNGMLMRRWDVLGTTVVHWQCIIPMSQRRTVLKYSHDIKASGHLGIKKTLSKIRQSYYWPGLQNDVKAYLGGCEACTKRKDPNKTKRAPMGIVRSGFPMERIAIDILGELPMTDRNNKYIRVIGDYFTKWVECFAMPNMEARTVATISVEEVIARFGIPQTIHSDQGRQFESSLFREMCQLLQIEKTRTTPYHPQSDGMVERFNKTLVTMLSAFVNNNHSDWDTQLPYVLMAYRATEHETTGVSPNMCMLGREATTPLDILYEMPTSIKTIPQNQWVWELQERMESAHSLVRQHTENSMHRQKRNHDKGLSYETLQTGDRVFVFFPVKKIGCSSKLTSFWRGPYDIMAKLSDVLYKVNCGRNHGVQVIHCDRLRKSKSQVLAGECSPGIDDDQPDVTPEVEAEHCLEENPETVSFPKRKRHMPAWLSDYVLSIFRGVDSMPKTKTTNRMPEAVCPSCKSSVANTNFKFHLLTCAGNEYGCDICLKTFKKKAYLSQHNKRKHSDELCTSSLMKNSEQNSSNTQVPVSGEQDLPSSESEEDAVSDENDWEKEPEIELIEEDNEQPPSETSSREDDKEQRQSDTTSKDEDKKQFQSEAARSSTSSVDLGRVVRKRTTPAPVAAPKKKKELGTSVESKVMETSRVNKHGLEMTYGVEINTKGRNVRSVSVKQDGESMMQYNSSGAGSIQMDLSEFIGQNVALRPQDVKVEIRGGEVKINVDYEEC